MSVWKQRWVELIGDSIAQFQVWQEHWLKLHPEDTPPQTVSDDDNEAATELFQNLDKYCDDPEVQELCRRYKNVESLDHAREIHILRSKERPLV